jgi:hypothetical protein
MAVRSARQVCACLSVLSALLLGCGGSFAAQRETVCARYMSTHGWSQRYKMNAVLIKGVELNQITRSHKYHSVSIYAVVYWNEEEANFVELSLPFQSPIGQAGVDERGVRWEIAKTDFCL